MKLEFESQSASLPMVDPSHLGDFTPEGGSAEADEMLRKGIEAAQSGDRSEARTYLLGVTDEDPDNESAWLWLASISEYPEELLVFLNNVLRINPENERAMEWAASTRSLLARNFVQRGSDASQNGDDSLAKQCFMQAIVHDERSEAAWLWLASVSDSDGEKKSYLGRVLRIDPENESALGQMEEFRSKAVRAKLMDANRLAIAGGREEAEALLSEILEKDPSLEDAWMLKAHLAESFDEKIECFEHVLELNEDNQVARANLESLKMIVGNAPSGPAVEADDSEVHVMETEFYSSNGDLKNEDHAPESDSSESPTEVSEAEEVEPAMEAAASEDAGEEPSFVSEEVDLASDDPAMDDDEIFASDPDRTEGNEEFEGVTMFEFDEVSEPDLDPISQPESAAELESPETSFEAETADEEGEAREFVPVQDDEFLGSEPVAAASDETCPFCSSQLSSQGFVCQSCNAVLTLSDLEMLLSNSDADVEVLDSAVKRMESEQSVRGIVPEELVSLGIAYINMKQYRKGFEYLQEYAAKNPNDVVVRSQVDALAVRVSEIEQQNSSKEAQPTAKTILVVDDSPTIRKLISLKLQKCGHETICAVDGVDALEKINDVVPDLVLLDITMPRMDGYQVCKLIRGNEATKDVPVVMISGKDGFFDKVRGKMVGTSDYITKPFGPETLMRTVNDYLM